MEYTNKNKIYIFLKITIYLIGFLSLISISNYWVGTKENWDEIIKDEFIPAFIVRTIFLIVVGLVFLGFSFWVNYLYKKEYSLPKELFFLTIFSLLLNIWVMLIL